MTGSILVSLGCLNGHVHAKERQKAVKMSINVMMNKMGGKALDQALW